jgi:hypothetical protein
MQKVHFSFLIFSLYICDPARVAKLVDALSSGGSIRKVVLVRIQSRAQSLLRDSGEGFLIWTHKMLAFKSGQIKKTGDPPQAERRGCG